MSRPPRLDWDGEAFDAERDQRQVDGIATNIREPVRGRQRPGRAGLRRGGGTGRQRILRKESRDRDGFAVAHTIT